MRTDYDDNCVSLRLAFRPFVNSFQFRGRSTRTELVSFWLLGIMSGLIHFAVDLQPTPLAYVAGLVWIVLWTWPWIPLQVRRLHDQDRSGWWAVGGAVPLVIWLAGWQFAPASDSGGISLSVDWGFFRASQKIAVTTATIAGAIIFVAFVMTSLVLFLLPGTGGKNRFGPDPRLLTET